MGQDIEGRTQPGEVAVFNPRKTHDLQARADAAIDYARRVMDGPTLEEAVRVKIDDQAAFVGWWEATVSVRESPGRLGVKSKRGTGRSISKDAAERDTGISHQTVSKWRQRLAEPDRYREMLYGTAYAKAMAEASGTIAAAWTGVTPRATPRRATSRRPALRWAASTWTRHRMHSRRRRCALPATSTRPPMD